MPGSSRRDKARPLEPFLLDSSLSGDWVVLTFPPADNDCSIMDDTLLAEQLRQSHQRNEAMLQELAVLHASLDPVLQSQQALRREYEALVDATRAVEPGTRYAAARSVAELEAANRRMVDMLWGRRSERRSESADQQHLNFGDEPLDVPSTPEQEILSAQDQADEEQDRELLKRLEDAERPAGRNNSRAVKSFPRASNAASGSLIFPRTRSRA